MMRPRTGFFAAVDAALTVRARRGDKDALECLYRIFSRPVFNLARRVCRSEEEAQEVLQETFLEIVRSICTLRGDGAIGAWVRRIAVSKALMAVRRTARSSAREVVTNEKAGNPSEIVPIAGRDSYWRRLDLERALARLPDTARAVVWLHDVEGLTHAEIAEAFNRTPSFSKSQLSRAHARLRSWLNRTGGSSDASRDARIVGSARR